MIYKIHIVILVAISVDLKLGDDPGGTVNVRVSAKLDSTWEHFHGWVSGMDLKTGKKLLDAFENDHPAVGAKLPQCAPSGEHSHYQEVSCHSNGGGVIGLNCKSSITSTMRNIIGLIKLSEIPLIRPICYLSLGHVKI